MHPQTTNNRPKHAMFTALVSSPRGALEFVNEYSGLAVVTGSYIGFAGLKHACPFIER